MAESSPRHVFLDLQGHELHVTEWGDPSLPLLVMSHGLTRTGRDFDELAMALCDKYFVVCPDQIGRGLSSWSQSPHKDYCLTHYAKIAIDMIDFYGKQTFSWIGTSMGGLIGMWLASGDGKSRMQWLIVNDIAPELPQAALDRIVTYARKTPEFDTLKECEERFRTMYAPFGPASDAFWTRIAMTSIRRNDAGKYTFHYDTEIVSQIEKGRVERELPMWDRYDTISCPMAVIRGINSDLLKLEYVEKMQNRGPKPQLHEFDCGHAPTLSRPQDISRIAAVIKSLETNK